MTNDTLTLDMIMASEDIKLDNIEVIVHDFSTNTTKNDKSESLPLHTSIDSANNDEIQPINNHGIVYLHVCTPLKLQVTIHLVHLKQYI